MEASQFVHAIEKQQGMKVACLEEIAFKNEWITLDSVKSSGEVLSKTDYGKYLLKLK